MEDREEPLTASYQKMQRKPLSVLLWSSSLVKSHCMFRPGDKDLNRKPERHPELVLDAKKKKNLSTFFFLH